jgi:hypothetical protein
MGFDLCVDVTFHMCHVEGKPFYYSKGDMRKIYDISIMVVPEHLRKALQLRGHFLFAYTDHFNAMERFNVDANEFLEYFPSWENVLASDMYDDYWTEEDHNRFNELLKWCVNQDVYFQVSWSY